MTIVYFDYSANYRLKDALFLLEVSHRSQRNLSMKSRSDQWNNSKSNMVCLDLDSMESLAED